MQADSTRHNRVAIAEVVDDGTLASIWFSDGIGAKIIKCQVDDAIRPWFGVIGDTTGKITAELDRLNFRETLRNACNWARLYGGSIIIKGWADGLPLSAPRTNSNRPLLWLREYPVTRAYFNQADIDTNPSSPTFEKPLQYHVTFMDGSQVDVHHSRCVVIKGVAVPGDQYSSSNYRLRHWGMSTIQQAYERLAALGSSFQALDGFMKKFAIGKYKLAGLRDAISSNNSSLIYKRMEIMNASASLLNGVFLDADGNEDFTRDVVGMGGTVEFLDREMMALCGCPGVPPLTRLFGRSPAGLNATGENDIRTYYDDVVSYQTTTLTNAVLDIVRAVNAGMKKTVKDSKIKIKWGNPYTPTEKEMTENRNRQAQTDKIYFDMQVIDSEEIRKNRFEGEYSFETVVDSTELPELEGTEEEPEMGEESAQRSSVPKVPDMSAGANSASGATQAPKK
jgi:phage-related protein (TIGR01555 family)